MYFQQPQQGYSGMVGGGGSDYTAGGYGQTDPSSYGGWNSGGTLDNSQYGGQQNW